LFSCFSPGSVAFSKSPLSIFLFVTLALVEFSSSDLCVRECGHACGCSFCPPFFSILIRFSFSGGVCVPPNWSFTALLLAHFFFDCLLQCRFCTSFGIVDLLPQFYHGEAFCKRPRDGCVSWFFVFFPDSVCVQNCLNLVSPPSCHLWLILTALVPPPLKMSFSLPPLARLVECRFTRSLKSIFVPLLVGYVIRGL